MWAMLWIKACKLYQWTNVPMKYFYEERSAGNKAGLWNKLHCKYFWIIRYIEKNDRVNTEDQKDSRYFLLQQLCHDTEPCGSRFSFDCHMDPKTTLSISEFKILSHRNQISCNICTVSLFYKFCLSSYPVTILFIKYMHGKRNTLFPFETQSFLLFLSFVRTYLYYSK